MKKSIVVCCEAMDQARIDRFVSTEGGGDSYTVIKLHETFSGNVQRSTILFCPWCGKGLPFPYEEDDG